MKATARKMPGKYVTVEWGRRKGEDEVRSGKHLARIGAEGTLCGKEVPDSSPRVAIYLWPGEERATCRECRKALREAG